MSTGLIHGLSAFATGVEFAALPAEVVRESKRLILDSIGCALAAQGDQKGDIGIRFGEILGGASDEATIIGSDRASSIFGAAFANSELINGLDYDAILPPGHVTPYVLPVALALGEAGHSAGRELIVATAIAHEMSFRFGKAMDNLRDTKDGQVDPPPVFGYSSTLFGATAQAARLKNFSTDRTAHALGIAACISPVNYHWSWFHHPQGSTIKYQLGGVITQAALTAAYMAELGHRGDLQVLDDGEFGYRRFIGSRKWDSEHLVNKLGQDWLFPSFVSFKPYPHCRVMHSAFGAMNRALDENNIRPDEIDSIKVYVEAMTEQPVWLNRDITHVQEAQFSIAHGMALAAHRLPMREWQNPEHVYSPSVLALMDRVTAQVHPDYVNLLKGNAASRPAVVEIKARGETIVAEQRYPKGSSSPEAWSYMTDDELCAKFRDNCQGVLSASATDVVVEALMNLERIEDFATVMREFRVPRAAAPVDMRAPRRSSAG